MYWSLEVDFAAQVQRFVKSACCVAVPLGCFLAKAVTLVNLILITFFLLLIGPCS